VLNHLCRCLLKVGFLHCPSLRACFLPTHLRTFESYGLMRSMQTTARMRNCALNPCASLLIPLLFCSGDALTLRAIIEHYGVKITIYSSVANPKFDISLHPSLGPCKHADPVLLGIVPEVHYVSVVPAHLSALPSRSVLAVPFGIEPYVVICQRLASCSDTQTLFIR
jgi:hypothetical protein